MKNLHRHVDIQYFRFKIYAFYFFNIPFYLLFNFLSCFVSFKKPINAYIEDDFVLYKIFIFFNNNNN